MRVTYSVHTAPGSDPGGNVKDNQVRLRRGCEDPWGRGKHAHRPVHLHTVCTQHEAAAGLRACAAGGARPLTRSDKRPLRAALRPTTPHAAPGTTLNECTQDAWAVKERLGAQEMALFGVFDGHGQEGKAVSHHICATLPRLVSRSTLCKVRRRGRDGGLPLERVHARQTRDAGRKPGRRRPPIRPVDYGRAAPARSATNGHLIAQNRPAAAHAGVVPVRLLRGGQPQPAAACGGGLRPERLDRHRGGGDGGGKAGGGKPGGLTLRGG